MTIREGDQGTWSHCGNGHPHAPHMHTFAMNEGPYTAQCNGTAEEERAYSHTELKAMLEARGVSQQTAEPTIAVVPETETYIVVRVKHPRVEASTKTAVAIVRQAIHDVAEEYALRVGDIVLPEPTRPPMSGTLAAATQKVYPLVSYSYETVIDISRKQVAMRLMVRGDSKLTDEEKAYRRHQRRAQRALMVVEGYVAKYGEEGLRSRSKKNRGRRALGVPVPPREDVLENVHCGEDLALVHTSDGPTLQCIVCKREWKTA